MQQVVQMHLLVVSYGRGACLARGPEGICKDMFHMGPFMKGQLAETIPLDVSLRNHETGERRASDRERRGRELADFIEQQTQVIFFSSHNTFQW